MTTQITWLKHSGFRVVKNGFTLVVDPGLFAVEGAMDGADAVLITHQHPDHYYPPVLQPYIDTHRGLPIYTNSSVAALLEGSGAKVHRVGHGDAFDIGGFSVHVHGQWHAPIHKGIERVRNIGFMLDRGHLFFPGDAYTDPETQVDLMMVPLHGTYTKAGDLYDFIESVKPRRVSPCHDISLNDLGLQGMDTFLAEKPGGSFVTLGTGVPYTRLPLNQPYTV